MPTPDNIRSLVEPGRVHRSVYTDPDIFDLELERVFGNAWIYVGHESEIERPGDFIATRIGRKPLLLARTGWQHCTRPQSMRPSRRDGRRLRLRTYRRISLLLSRLDLSTRWPHQGGTVVARLSAAFRPKEPHQWNEARAAGGELSRLRVRQLCDGRAEPGRIFSAT